MGDMTIDDYCDDYVMDGGDEGCYTPNAHERAILRDALHGVFDFCFEDQFQQLQQENTELKSQLEALQAHVERLRELVLFYAVMADEVATMEQGHPVNYCEVNARELLEEEHPAQSLNHIKARVEEETIERIQVWLSTEETTWFGAEDVVMSIPNIPRKYAKQEKKDDAQ